MQQRLSGRPSVRTAAQQVAATTSAAVRQLAGGLGTAVLCLLLLGWLGVVAVLSLAGVGLLLVLPVLRQLRRLADRERTRLGRWGAVVIPAGPPPSALDDARRDPGVVRELRWLVVHATWGLVLGSLGVLLPLYAVRDMSFPAWWWLLPGTAAERAPWWWPVHDRTDAFGIALLGCGWAALTVGATPRMAALQASAGRRWLPPPPGTDLPLRLAELTATRAAALDAHGAELRRIERSLHDGTQNRLVGVTVLLGAARRALARDPDGVDELLGRAQGAAEDALAELRTVVRSILPPVLADRGLAGALAGLAADCPVPCQVDADVLGRCATSVEATAYFVVAEALTNVARHSGADLAQVTVQRRDDTLLLRVRDDGVGAADDSGSGLRGIRSRVAAHDGTFTLTSPAGGPTTLEVRLPCGS